MYPPVNPILVQLGPLSIHWYGIFMAIAVVLGAYIPSRYIARHGQDPTTIWDMLLWVLIPGVIGARLYFVFIQSPRGPNGLDQYLAHPIEILQIWNGGIHIYGALIFGGIALLLYLRACKLPALIYLDGIGLGLLLGQSIGRIGNFINQELYGPPTTLPWGLRIDAAHRVPPYNDMFTYPDSVRFQPLFLYEMLWDALGFVLLFWISRRFKARLKDGDLLCAYLIWSPLGRFFIEFFRSDSWFFPGTPFDTVHLITALAVIGASITIFFRHRQRPQTVVSASVESNNLVSDVLISSDLEGDTQIKEALMSASQAPVSSENDDQIIDNQSQVYSEVTSDVPEEKNGALEDSGTRVVNAALPSMEVEG